MGLARQIFNLLNVPDRPNGGISTGGYLPAVTDDFYKWSWDINYKPLAYLYEDGNLYLKGNVYAECPERQGGYALSTGTLVNEISNLKNPQQGAITGLPALVDQVFSFSVNSIDVSTNQVLFTGSDRQNTYTNAPVTQFEFYYNDVIELNFTQNVYSQYIANGNFLYFSFQGIDTSVVSGGVLSYMGEVSSTNQTPTFYIKLSRTATSYYFIEWINFTNTRIDFNLQNINDYTNDNFLTTDEYILKYFPHTNTYEWRRNFWAEDTGAVEPTIIPVGSFKAKRTTNQISARKTLSTAVPIEKVSQTTTYSVFNGEVEINKNILLESVNTDIGTLFTIYSNENKKDPTTGNPSFKDRASIILEDTNNDWVFAREPESEYVNTARTIFKHDGNNILIIKSNRVESTQNFKAPSIQFMDVSVQSTAVTALTLAGVAFNYLSLSNNRLTAGIVPISLGGTGSTTASGARTALGIIDSIPLPSNPVTGEYLYYNGTAWVSNAVSGGGSYGDADVKTVLSNSAGDYLSWNTTSENFDVDMSNITNNITFITSGNTPQNPFIEIHDDGLFWIKSTGRNVSVGSARYYKRNANNVVSSLTFDYCMRLNSGLFLGGGNELALISTKKIKKDITDLTGEEALDLSLKLQPKKYKMKDYRKHGDNYRHGYISEEVNEIVPELTRLAPCEIPNIYEMAKVISKDTIQIDKELKVGETYIYYYHNDKQMELKVIEKQDDNKYKVIVGTLGDEELPKCDEIFIFGIYEESLILKYDQFHAIHTKSIQHLQGIISKQQEQIDTLMEILKRNNIN